MTADDQWSLSGEDTASDPWDITFFRLVDHPPPRCRLSMLSSPLFRPLETKWTRCLALGHGATYCPAFFHSSKIVILSYCMLFMISFLLSSLDHSADLVRASIARVCSIVTVPSHFELDDNCGGREKDMDRTYTLQHRRHIIDILDFFFRLTSITQVRHSNTVHPSTLLFLSSSHPSHVLLSHPNRIYALE
ncbi:hypothetical protein M422DRAFT_242137 [Sphaerobolus stellatus SS14]|nr:hypothetical protein M422DRAFT_242137 [Sphaerobolus stellatus SS14]